MMRILITGSAGFIGSHLVDRLLEVAYKIEPFSLMCVDKKPKLESTLRMNVSSNRFLKHFKKAKFDYIFHFGSPCSILQFNKDPGYCINDTLTGFRNILKLAETSGAKLIYPSSGNVYGSKKKPHCETDKITPVNLYGICKAWCESMAQSPKVNSVGLRIYCGYGAGEEMKGSLASVLYQFLNRMMKGKAPIIWGDGSQTRDFIYIDDVVEGILTSVALEGIPFVNIASGVSTDYNDLVKLINKVLETDLSPQYIEKPEHYVEKTFADIHLMRLTLGLNPRSLENGITQFVEHLDSKY